MLLMCSVDWTLLKKESELEDISLETNETEKKDQKTNQRTVGQLKKKKKSCGICITECQNEKKGAEATSEARMIENFFMLMKESKQIQEDHTTQKINAKKHYTYSNC